MGKVIIPNMSIRRSYPQRFNWRIAWSIGSIAVMCYAALTEPFASLAGRSPVWAIAITLLCLQLVIAAMIWVFITHRPELEESECEA